MESSFINSKGFFFLPVSVYIIKHKLVDSITKDIHDALFQILYKDKFKVYLVHEFPANFMDSEALTKLPEDPELF